MPKISKREANKVCTPDLKTITDELTIQKTIGGNFITDWRPQLQFILSNEYYVRAALAAIRAGKVEKAVIVPTGMGGYSFELQCSRDTVAKVRDVYDAECDAMGLY